MSRRSIIKPGRSLKFTALLGGTLLLLAVISCTVRIARFWNTFDQAGAGTYRSVVMEHGRLIWDSNTGPFAPSPGTPPVLNWQFDPGVTWTTYRHQSSTYPAPMGGNAVATAHEVSLFMPLATLGLLLLFMTLPLFKNAGHCACGYNLRGITSTRCPECGAAVQQPKSA